MFVQIFSDEAVTSLKTSALLPHPMHVQLLNFSKNYKKLMQSGLSSAAFRAVETETSKAMREADTGDLENT